MTASAKTEWSQADTDISKVEEKMYQSGTCVPNLKACMEERDFNMKMAEEKKKVHIVQSSNPSFQAFVFCRATLLLHHALIWLYLTAEKPIFTMI